ncbi:5516_t:CDS:2, partial [Gigaspora rosea]
MDDNLDANKIEEIAHSILFSYQDHSRYRDSIAEMKKYIESLVNNKFEKAELMNEKTIYLCLPQRRKLIIDTTVETARETILLLKKNIDKRISEKDEEMQEDYSKIVSEIEECCNEFSDDKIRKTKEDCDNRISETKEDCDKRIRDMKVYCGYSICDMEVSCDNRISEIKENYDSRISETKKDF